MGSNFVKGAIIITIATMLSKILGSVFRIPLQNIAGDEVLGIFTIVYPVYMSVLILTVAGIPLAISKLIAEARVEGRKDDVYYIYRTASILALGFGLISTALMVMFADWIAGALGGSFAYYSILVVSITLLFAPYMAVYRGLFQGFEDMKPTAISQVLEQFVRVAIILAVAYILTIQQRSDEVVAAGVMIGSIIGVLASLVYLLMLFRRKKQTLMEKATYNVALFKTWSKHILIVAIPICIGALTMAFLNMVDSLTIPIQLGKIGHAEQEVTYLYGIYGRGLALVQIAVVFASALILPLIPHITSAVKKGEVARTRLIIEKANKFTHLTAWPAAIGLVALTLPVNLALFTDLEGNLVIAILSLSALFTAFSVLTTGILQGMNLAKHAAVIVISAAVIKVVLNLILVSQYGLIGAAISTLVTYIILTGLNLFMIYRATPYTILQREGFVFALGSIVMGAVVAGPLFFFDISEWSRLQALLYLFGMIAVGALIYVAFIIIFKGLSKNDLESLPIIGKYFRKSEPTGGRGPKESKAREDVFGVVRKILWGIVIAALLFNIPALMERNKAEQRNNMYEVTVPFEQIEQMLLQGEGSYFSREEIFTRLYEAGVQSVGFEPFSINYLEDRAIVREISKGRLVTEYEYPSEQLSDVNGLYLEIIQENHPLVAKMYDAFAFEYEAIHQAVGGVKQQLEMIEVENKKIVFIPNATRNAKVKSLGFDMELANQLVNAGLMIIPRLSDDMTLLDHDDHYIYSELAMLKDLGANKILFKGQSVVSQNLPVQQTFFAKMVKELGYNIVPIEFFSQLGMDRLLRVGELQEDIVRLLSLTIGKGAERNNSIIAQEKNKAIRAIKERNIRIIHVNALRPGESFNNAVEVHNGIEGLELLVQKIHQQLPSKFEPGVSQPYESIGQSKLGHLVTLLGAAAFLVLFVQRIVPRLTILGALGIIAVVGLQFITGHATLLKGIALLVGVAAATLAVLSVGKVEGFKQVILKYVLAVAIALTGAAFIVSLLYGTVFLVKTDQFTGVKVLAGLPFILGGVILLNQEIKALIKMVVKYWHVAIMLAVGAVLFYYILRTGNEGVTVGAELQFRQLLEDILYVRPRTTEFLIGLPLFFLGLYMTMLKKKYAKLFLAAGFIAFASMVGTFTHLHTPLYISGLRTLYSAISGIILGGVLVVLYQIWLDKIYPRIKTRWEL